MTHEWRECVASSELAAEGRLTHQVQAGLQLLDQHMSSSRRNQKHLKETFGRFAAGIAEAGGLGETRQRQEFRGLESSDCLRWWTSIRLQTFFALRRSTDGLQREQVREAHSCLHLHLLQWRYAWAQPQTTDQQRHVCQERPPPANPRHSPITFLESSVSFKNTFRAPLGKEKAPLVFPLKEEKSVSEWFSVPRTLVPVSQMNRLAFLSRTRNESST